MYDHVERTRLALTEVVVKRHRTGTHRTVAPQETLARLLGLMPTVGITRVANVTGLDKIGIPVVMVCRPNARSLAVSQGKGIDLASAKVSGIMEAMETYHAEHIELPIVSGSFEDLKRRKSVVDIALLPHIAEGPFDANVSIPWIAGYDLMSEREMLVPFEVVHMNYTRDVMAHTTNFFSTTSTGLASGNHPLEAICHAICEIIERDALMIWRLGAEAPTSSSVELDRVADPVCRQLLDKYAAARVAVHAWDISSDIGIPVYVCLICDKDSHSLCGVSTAVGVGCHLDTGIALSRALTEAAQSRLTFISGSRDDMSRGLYDHMLNVSNRHWVESFVQSDAIGVEADRLRTNNAGTTFGEDLRRCLDRLRAVGVENVIAIDITKNDFEGSVVRVVIPGLECAVFGHDVALPGGRAAKTVLQKSLRRAIAGAIRREAPCK